MPEHIRTSRRRFLTGGAAVVVIAACSGDDDADKGAAEAVPSSTTTTSTTTTTIDPALAAVAPLTGVRGPFKPLVGRSALVVKIDNHLDARPPFGLHLADVIVEERVESGVSRLMSVFHSRIPSEVGPIRSTRSTDWDLLPLFGRPVYASSGGNEGVMNGLFSVDIVDVGHNRGGTGFRRIGRPGPHNLVAEPEALYGRAGDDISSPPEPIFAFLGENERLPDSARPTSEVIVDMGEQSRVRYRWHANSKTWRRFYGSTPHETDGGQHLAPTNVVICEIPYQFGGGGGRSTPHGVTTGEGPVHVLVNGKLVQGTWNRPTPADRFRLRDGDGDPIKLQRGQTYIELPSVGTGAVRFP